MLGTSATDNCCYRSGAIVTGVRAVAGIGVDDHHHGHVTADLPGPISLSSLRQLLSCQPGCSVVAPELLPGSLCHVPPQVDGFGFGELAKPLKLAGAPPLLK